MKTTRINICLCFALLIVGCQNDSRVSELEMKLGDANKKIEALAGKIEELKKDREFDKLVKDNEGYAFLTPGSDGYAPIRYDLGVLTVRLADIKPYANGSKVTLEFGNTLSATVTGLKATLQWGKVDEKGFSIAEQTKSKEVTFTESLQSGAWTRVSVVLDGVPPSEFGFVRLIDVSHSGIQLFKR